MEYMAYYESTSVQMDVHLKPHIVDTALMRVHVCLSEEASHIVFTSGLSAFVAAQWPAGFVAAGHDWSTSARGRSHQGGSCFQREGEDVVLMQ